MIGLRSVPLLRTVNRMVEPTSGSVLIDDGDVQDLDPVRLRRSIGYVLQAGGLLPHRTVLGDVTTVPVLDGASRRAVRVSGLALLERVGLDVQLASR